MSSYKETIGTIIPSKIDEIIKFAPDTYVGVTKRCEYPQGSKQLYIIENLLKTIIRSKELVYVDNTEPLDLKNISATHLYGLASGWKTVDLARHIGLNNLESITVYDRNQTQLDYAKWLHLFHQRV